MSERIPSPARPWIGWTLFVLVLLFILAGWLVVRGIGAGDALRNAARSADSLRIAIIDGDQRRIQTYADRVTSQASSAHSLTSDPVWRAAEWLPWLGSGMKELRELSEASDELASVAVPALLDAAGSVDIAAFGVLRDQISVVGLNGAQRSFAQIGRAADAAAEVLESIDLDEVGGPTRDSVLAAHEGLSDAVRKLSAMSGAAELVPSMLGGQEPRTYLLVAYNPNQIRSSGGVIETVTRVTVGPETIELDRTLSAASIADLESPAVDDLDQRMLTLMPEGIATRFRDISAIPDFPTAARLLAAHWQSVEGEELDGVIAIDPTTVQLILGVIGEVHTADRTFTSHGIVELLSQKLALELDSAQEQTTVFASAVGTTLAEALGSSRTAQIVAALYDAADSGHLHLWSAHEQEQARIAVSAAGGAFPASDGRNPVIGVFANDLTGARLDAYTSARIEVEYGQCEGTPTTQVSLTWSNDFESAAETEPSTALTGPVAEGHEPGTVRTQMSVYGPVGATARAAAGTLAQRPVVQQELTVEPEAKETMTVTYTGTGAGVRPQVRHSFLLAEPEIELSPLIDCG